MKGQISASQSTKFNLKFLLEIILVIIIGAIIFIFIILSASPSKVGSVLTNYSINLYNIMKR